MGWDWSTDRGVHVHVKGSRRPAPVAVFAAVALALGLALGLTGLVPPAWAAGSIRLTVSPTTPLVGHRTVLVARIQPAVAHRPVAFQRWTGSRWAAVGSNRTSSRGVARVATRLSRIGSVRLRAVAARYRGQPRRVVTRTVVVKGPSAVTAAFPAGPWALGSSVTVRATVSPHQSGRRVIMQRYSGGAWRGLAAATTSGTGVAVLHWTAGPVGTASYRVYVPATTRMSAAASTPVHRSVADFVAVTAPTHATTGGTVDVSVKVTARAALSGAVLTLHAPDVGSQLTPPNDFSVDASTHLATVDLGDLAAGGTRDLTLSWQAPDASATLTFATRLTAAGGIDEPDQASVAVSPAPAGSFHFDSVMTTEGQSRTRPYGATSYSRDCSAQVGATTAPDLATALGQIDSFVAAGTATDAWQALDLSAHPENADDVATLAFAANEPTAALAAAVQGYRDTPDDASFLNTAATAANAVLHPEWAIALETQAGTLDTSGSTGISVEAIRLANLGHAHALMGQWATGRDYLLQAVAIEPNGTQLRQELAAIEDCAGDQTAAVTDFGASLRPDGESDDVVQTDPQGNPTYSKVSAGKLWDLSLTTDPDLVMPLLPATPADLVAQKDYWDVNANQEVYGFWGQEYHRLHDLQNSLWSQETTLRNQLAAEDLEPVTRQQVNDILGRMNSTADASLSAPYQTLQNAGADAWWPNGCGNGEYSTYVFCGYQGTDADCGVHQTIFDVWKGKLQAWENAYQGYHGQAWQIFSGLQGNLADPTAQQLAVVLAKDHLLQQIESMVQDLWYSANAMPTQDNSANSCWGAPTQAAPDPSQVGGADPTACTASSLASRVALVADGKLSDDPEAPVGVNLKQTCASTSLTVSLTALPFLQGFVKVVNNRDGSGTTLYIGSRATAGGAKFESAFYLSFTSAGRVADLGVDTGPEYNLGSGPVQVTAYSDHLHMSAMSLFTSTPYTP